MLKKPEANTDSNSLKAIAPLIIRTIVFLAVFVLYSGLIGSKIVGGGIIYKDHFGIYGGLGKSAIFAAIAFVIMVVQRGYDLKLKSWKVFNLVWLILSAISYIGAWIGTDKLLAGNTSLVWVAIVQVLLIVSLIFAAGGIFGSANLRLLINKYKKELLYALGLVIVFYGFLTLVYGLWRVLATIVLHSVKWLLTLTGLTATIIPPRTLLLDKFGINIAQYCSGIESIALFTGLYALIGILDWKRFNHKKLLLVFPIALLLLFGLNILRVYALILGGYYINAHIAFSLFHTYAGMVFFIVYSVIFWTLLYRWMLVKNNTNKRIKGI